MKRFIFILLSFFSFHALSNETHLLCEYNGKALKGEEIEANLGGTTHYYFNEKKQSFEVDGGITLCNLYRNNGTYKEYILIDKKSIFFQCTVTDIKNMGMTTNKQEQVKINRISGEYSWSSKGNSIKGEQLYSYTQGFCKKADAKF